jgi:hypothetical protein
MNLEFVLCGSPTDAFWSQAAMFRLSLDSLGDVYRNARLAFCVGASRRVSLPERWKPYFKNIEVIWVDEREYLREGDRVQSDLTYRAVSYADLSFNCDADTLLLRPFPDGFLEQLYASPAIYGVIAHYPPPIAANPALRDDCALWSALGEHIISRRLSLDHRYTLLDELKPCPFYVNYGFVAATPKLFRQLHEQLRIVEPQIRDVLDNEYYGQLGVAVAVERASLATKALPMRFNFPNDPIADQLYPHELANVVLIHYLRTKHFDRHKIFANQQEFERFMAAPLSGSNFVFREYVRTLTGGQYPFDGRDN